MMIQKADTEECTHFTSRDNLQNGATLTVTLVLRCLNVKTIDSTVRLHQAGTLPKDISIAFYLSSSLPLVSLLF